MPTESSVILSNPLWPLQIARVYTRKGPLSRKHMDLLPQSLHVLARLCDAEEVLKELRARFLLEGKRELDGAVQEGGNFLVIFLSHVAGGER